MASIEVNLTLSHQNVPGKDDFAMTCCLSCRSPGHCATSTRAPVSRLCASEFDEGTW